MKEAMRVDGIDEMLTADHGDVRASVGQHATKIAADRTRAHHCDARPCVRLIHAAANIKQMPAQYERTAAICAGDNGVQSI
jgi:hypothetical protein